MTANDEYLPSDTFDTPNSTMAFDLNQSKSAPSHPNFCDNYLRETIGEPLSSALAYVIIYRPEDPIEFISSKSRSHHFFILENLFLRVPYLHCIGNRLLPIA